MSHLNALHAGHPSHAVSPSQLGTDPLPADLHDMSVAPGSGPWYSMQKSTAVSAIHTAYTQLQEPTALY